MKVAEVAMLTKSSRSTFQWCVQAACLIAAFLLVVVIILFALARARTLSAKTSLYSVNKDGKWGLIDEKVRLVIKPQFCVISQEPKYDAGPEDFENHYLFSDEESLFYITSTSKVMTETGVSSEWIREIEAVGDGIFRLRSKVDSMRLFDARGLLVLPEGWASRWGVFSEGMLPCECGKRWGYVDRRGKIVHQFGEKYDFVESYHSGFAIMSANGRMGVIDRGGLETVEPSYLFIDEFAANGLAFAINAKKEMVYIDGNGSEVISLEDSIGNASRFSDGLARIVERSSGRTGFIDETGQMVIEARFLTAEPYSEGLAAVSINRTGDGYINKQGELVIELDGVVKLDSFSRGLAWVETVEKVGYINKEGEWMWAQEVK